MNTTTPNTLKKVYNDLIMKIITDNFMLIHLLFILGICVEAITGAMAAGRKNMDFFGVIVIACITALGGGTVRDVLFASYPITWVEHPEYLAYTSISAFIAIQIGQALQRWKPLFLVLDALGLATFVIIGTQKTLTAGLPPSIAMISGMLTGVSGGMLRDILCNDIPLVLRRELYAVIALAGALIFVVLDTLHISNYLNSFITMSVIFLTRLLAIHFHIEIPKFKYRTDIQNH